MALEPVKAQVKSGDRADEVFEVKYDIPANVAEALDRFGEEIVYSRFRGSLVIDLQSFMRRQIEKDGADSATVQEAASSWKPGVRAAGKTTAEKLSVLLGKLTPEERAEALAELQDLVS